MTDTKEQILMTALQMEMAALYHNCIAAGPVKAPPLTDESRSVSLPAAAMQKSFRHSL